MNYLFPIRQLLTAILDVYSFLLVMWIILSLLNHFDILNRRHTIVIKVMRFLEALFEPPLKLIRKLVPTIGGVDISPGILYFIILFLKETINTLVF